MATINSPEYVVFMHLKPSLCPHWFEGVKATEAANNIDRRLKDMPCACEKSGKNGMVNIEASIEMI